MLGKAFNKAKELGSKTKKTVSEKLKEQKRKIAVDVINDTDNKVKTKQEHIHLDRARQIVVNKFNDGGGVEFYGVDRETEKRAGLSNTLIYGTNFQTFKNGDAFKNALKKYFLKENLNKLSEGRVTIETGNWKRLTFKSNKGFDKKNVENIFEPIIDRFQKVYSYKLELKDFNDKSFVLEIQDKMENGGGVKEKQYVKVNNIGDAENILFHADKQDIASSYRKSEKDGSYTIIFEKALNITNDMQPRIKEIIKNQKNKMKTGGGVEGETYICEKEGRIEIYSGTDVRSAEVKIGDTFVVTKEMSNGIYYLGKLKTKGSFKLVAGLSGKDVSKSYYGNQNEILYLLRKENIGGDDDFFAQFKKIYANGGGVGTWNYEIGGL